MGNTNIKEWLVRTYAQTPLHTRRRIVCKDGYSVSAQANSFAYCTPRTELKDGNYTHVELGFPSASDKLINEYAEGCYIRDEKGYTGTVYPYVPVGVVEELIKKHGGIDWRYI